MTPPSHSPEASGCGPLREGLAHECCDASECATDQYWRSVVEFCSCASANLNFCTDTPCAADTECGTGSVCRPSSFLVYGDARCLAPRCESDADCTTRPGRRCSAVFMPPLQGGEVRLREVCCVYPASEMDNVGRCEP